MKKNNLIVRMCIQGEELHIYTPYNQDFISRIKKFEGAHWTGFAWAIPKSKENAKAAYYAIKEVYGEDTEFCLR